MINGHNETQRRLKKFMYKTGQFADRYSYIGCTTGVQKVTTNEDKSYYQKWVACKRYKKVLQKYGNRKIRYYKGDIKDGAHCFKIYNAKWEIW
jgi:hypothetical protein